MGSLYRNDLNKYKCWFDDASEQLGIDVQYRYIIERQTENTTGESIYSKLSKPIKQAVIIESGLPKVESLKQLGWFVDANDEQILVDFSVNTPNLQEGCRFCLESNENLNQTKWYRVVKLSNEELYPSCIKCLCTPVLETESKYDDIDNSISYGQQDILSDEENYTFINDRPNLTIF